MDCQSPQEPASLSLSSWGLCCTYRHTNSPPSPFHPCTHRPIDPSLFIDRYTNLLGLEQEVSKAIAHTAVRLVASMKRDWIQTGRRPSGICGAALFIATHIHGGGGVGSGF